MNSLFFFFFVQISLPKSVGSLSGRLLVLCLLFLLQFILLLSADYSSVFTIYI